MNIKILIEPTYSTEINSDRIKETNYIAYHVTLKKYEDSIKKEGLKIRNKKPGKQKYREFPQRIYFFFLIKILNMIQKKLKTM